MIPSKSDLYTIEYDGKKMDLMSYIRRVNTTMGKYYVVNNELVLKPTPEVNEVMRKAKIKITKLPDDRMYYEADKLLKFKYTKLFTDVIGIFLDGGVLKEYKVLLKNFKTKHYLIISLPVWKFIKDNGFMLAYDEIFPMRAILYKNGVNLGYVLGHTVNPFSCHYKPNQRIFR